MKKIIGWILLFGGILIMFLSLYSSYGIFTGKKNAPEVFKTETLQQNSLENDRSKLSGSDDLQEEIKKMINSQIQGIIPSAFISNLLNLISWSVFVGILILAGGKMSSIGINLLKASE